MSTVPPLQTPRRRHGRGSQLRAIIVILAGLAAGLSHWDAIARKNEEALLLRFERSLGATVEATVKPDIRYAIPTGRDMPEGLLVVSASDDGASAEPPIEVGDVITSIDGHRTRSLHDLASILEDTNPDATVRMKVTRHGAGFSTSLKRW